MNLPSNMKFSCFLLCTHVLQYSLSLEKEEIEDVFNSYANIQLLITLMLRNQKESNWKVTHNDCSPQERVEDRHTTFSPIFRMYICVLSSPRYANDSSAGNKLSVVRVP